MHVYVHVREYVCVYVTLARFDISETVDAIVIEFCGRGGGSSVLELITFQLGTLIE